MNKPEILAPVGGMDSLLAAVRSGADAVYLGAKEFSARSSAQNFSCEELSEAIRYCHIHGVQVYLTLNTLINDKEMQQALDLAYTAYNLGIDALIIQDLGLADILRKNLPKLPLHGSTQMSVHSPEGAKFLYDLGFKRVVLSREMTLAEIEAVAKSCPIELEVFVHGALCMSLSGQCYFSSVLGSRSGNRGKCAQPCRLPFKLQGGSPYALSLKDNSLIDHLPRLQEIGVKSLKIEGRMKRPEYVSAATKALREKLTTGSVSDKTQEELEGVFSRTGFTDGYLTGKRNGNMFGYRRHEDVLSSSQKLLNQIANGYHKEVSHIPVSLIFEARLGSRPTLAADDGENFAQVTGEFLTEEAQTLALSEEKCLELLQKTGGTPYFTENLTLNIDENISIPAREINLLRRSALEKLSELRGQNRREKEPPCEFTLPQTHRSRETLGRRARFTDGDIPRDFLDFDLVFVPLFTQAEVLKSLLAQGFNLGVEVPRGLFGREEKVKRALKTAKDIGITHALVGNLGGINPAKNLGFTLHGDFGLNITNSAALDFLKEIGFADTLLSIELSEYQVKNLGGSLPRGVVSYGYLPLMLTRNCPGYTSKEGCMSCNKRNFLQDRRGEKFIFTCDGNCSEILNCVPLRLSDLLCNNSLTDFEFLRFTVENSVEKVENSRIFSSNHPISGSFTRGLYKRGVK